MKLRRMALLLLIMLVCIPSAVVFARPTPANQLHAGMFPVGSRQRVEYASALNVRRGPGIRYTAFNHLTRGTHVYILEFRGGWARVNTNHGEGWIFTGYLSREMAAAAPSGTTTTGGGTVAAGTRTPQHLLRADLFPTNTQARVEFASHVNIRRGPANSYAAFTHLARGTTITILEYRNMWVRLDTSHGQGWIFAGFLSNDAVVAARGGAGSGGGTTTTDLGNRTPHAQLRAENFPNCSQQTVDYANFLNVRRGPGTGYTAFSHLNRGAVITVLEFRGGWVRISTTHGYGWIYAAYLRR